MKKTGSEALSTEGRPLVNDQAQQRWIVPGALIAVSLALIVLGQLTAKQGASILASGWDHLSAAAPFLLIAYTALFTRGVIWVLVLRRVALSLAYPMLALAYVVILAASNLLFHEPLGLMKIAGAALIVLGVTLIGFFKLKGEKTPS